jgi:hypothetical protein
VLNAPVLFSKWSWAGMQDGSITVTFRRWKRRQAVAGRVYRTPAGRIEVSAVDLVDAADITDRDAKASGYASADEVRAALRGDDSLPIYRIAFRMAAGPDPRDELAADAALTDDDRAELDRRLDRLDRASRHGPWTRPFLELIREHPARRAGDLAPMAGRDELQDFKLDVRKLKALGLTISLEVGYRLSPRGEAYLAGRR